MKHNKSVRLINYYNQFYIINEKEDLNKVMENQCQNLI